MCNEFSQKVGNTVAPPGQRDGTLLQLMLVNGRFRDVETSDRQLHTGVSTKLGSLYIPRLILFFYSNLVNTAYKCKL